jgi:hypothetical protein
VTRTLYGVSHSGFLWQIVGGRCGSVKFGRFMVVIVSAEWEFGLVCFQGEKLDSDQVMFQILQNAKRGVSLGE